MWQRHFNFNYSLKNSQLPWISKQSSELFVGVCPSLALQLGARGVVCSVRWDHLCPDRDKTVACSPASLMVAWCSYSFSLRSAWPLLQILCDIDEPSPLLLLHAAPMTYICWQHDNDPSQSYSRTFVHLENSPGTFTLHQAKTLCYYFLLKDLCKTTVTINVHDFWCWSSVLRWCEGGFRNVMYSSSLSINLQPYSTLGLGNMD